MKHPILAILLGIGLAGCEEARKTPPRVPLTFVNAAPSYNSIRFLREQVPEVTLGYRESASLSLGADEYDFHLEIMPAAGSPQRLVSFSLDLTGDERYTVVAIERGGELEHRLIATAGSAAGDNVEASLLHIAPTISDLDVYIVAPGTDPAAAVPVATVASGQDIGSLSVPSGNVQIVLTEAGNPAATLLTSTPLSLPAGAPVLIAILEEAGLGFADIAVIVAGGANLTLVDENLESSIRVINAISNRSALDFGVDGNLDPPLFANVAFGAVTGFDFIAPGARILNGTPAGNPSVTQVNFEFSATAGRFQTLFVAGEPGSATTVLTQNDFRAIAGEARVSIYNGVDNFELVDYFIVAPGTDIGTLTPTRNLASGAASANGAFAAGSYELTIRSTESRTILAGPVAISLAEGGNYGVLATDAVGGSTVDITLIDDFD